MAIRLVAMDLDGTLVDSRRNVSEYTKKVIAKYAALGVAFAFCSGRVDNEMDSVYAALPEVKYAILANGAYGLELPERRRIFANSLSPDKVRLIRATYAKYDHMFEIMLGPCVYSDANCLGRPEDYGAEYLGDVLARTRTPVDDMSVFVRDLTESADKVNIFFTSPQEQLKMIEIAAGLGTDFTHPERTNVEFTARGVNKGSGLKFLAETLGISPDEIMAIGDNNNDLTMLEYAVHSVAMGNSDDSIKKIARYVTDTNDNDGAAKAIERIIG